MAETHDVLDEHGRETGIRKTKAGILRDGSWRKVVHVWVVGDGGDLLVQKRAAGLATFENLWDVSVGGGIQSGEESDVAGSRELQEELGIVCTPKELEYLGRWQQTPKLMPNGMQDNDFSENFLLRRTIDPDTLALQAEEVSAVAIMPLTQLQETIKNPSTYREWVPHGVGYYIDVADTIIKLLNIK